MRLRVSLLLGTLATTAILACTNNAPLAILQPDPKNKVVDLDIEFDPKVDVLFVIDNSGSMNAHQTNLASNISLFTSVFLKKSVINYNIGVISTDDDGFNQPCCGQLEGNPKIVTKVTPNADLALAANIKVGTSGSASEASFAPTIKALGKELLSGWNAGFLRDEAALIVIFITDAEDQSDRISPKEFVDRLLALKGGDERKLLLYGAIIPEADPNATACGRDDPSAPPRRIEEALRLAPNAPDNVLGLCDPDYGHRLADFALQIVERTGLTVYLTRQPDVETIRVQFGKALLPNDKDIGWTFDPSRNAIQLGKKIDWTSQPPGSRVKIFYDKAKVIEEPAN